MTFSPIKPTLIIKNTSTADVNVLGVKIKPGQQKDLYKELEYNDGYPTTTILKELESPSGKIYRLWKVLGAIQIIDCVNPTYFGRGFSAESITASNEYFDGAILGYEGGSLKWFAAGTGGTGGVISIGLSTSLSGIAISNSPVTSSGSIFLSGTLGTQSGGTGRGSFDSGALLVGNGTSELASVSAAELNNVLISSGPSVPPAWGKIDLGAHTEGTLPVSSGGTGATTLSGYIRGNGTSALTASLSIPGADVAGNISGRASNVTGTVAVINGGTGATALNGYVKGSGTDPLTATSTIPGVDVAGNISGRASNVTGIVDVTNGGTGANALNGYVKGSGADPLTASATIPGTDIVGNIAGRATNVTGIVAVPNGGTGATSLAGYLKGNGTSPVTASAAIPGSDIVGDISGNASNVTGTVAVTNGGTGVTSITGYIKGSGTSAFTASATIPGTDVTGDIAGNAINVTGVVEVPNGGTGATFLTGYIKGDGSNPFTASSTIPASDLSGNIPIANGGTGAATAAAARINLGLGTAAVRNAGVANGVATLDSAGILTSSQLPASILGAVSYQGTWNAATNTPTLTSSTGTKGHYYVVSVAGTTNINGITNWALSDWIIFNGSAWEKLDNADSVVSVNGLTGSVVLAASDVGAPSSSGAGASGTWGISITGTATNVSGTVQIANGGTGATSKAAAFNALSPLTTKGDLVVFGTSNTRLPVGTVTGHVLTVDPTAALGVKWAAPGAGTVAGTGAANQIAFWSGSTTLSGESSLWWDVGADALGIRTSTPTLGMSVDVASGQVGIPAGSAALPSVAIRTSPSTGIFSPGANQLAIATNGVQKLNVKVDGVTIGAYTLPLSLPSNGQVLTATDGSGTVGWASPAATGVTSVGVSTTLSGLSISNTPVISSGTIAISGVLGVASGGTGATSLTGYVKGSGGGALTGNASIPGSDITGNISGNAANVTGTVALANGGTGASTKAGAFNALSPLSTKGDLLVFGTTNERLPNGTNGQILTVDTSTALGIKWASASAGTVTSVGVSTSLSGLTVTNSPVTGSGTIAIGGTLGVSSGGTGATSAFPAGSVVFAGTGGAYTHNSTKLHWDSTNEEFGIRTDTPVAALDVASGQVVTAGGSSTSPSFSFRSDNNTGIYSPAADQVAIATGGTQRVNVTTSGVTIGAYTLPLTDGTANQVLQTNGTGTLAWATVGGGGGGGSVDLTLTTTGLTVGDVCYVTSTSNVTAAANATAIATANAIGIVQAVGSTTGRVRNQGVFPSANFITGLTLAAGQTAYLSKTSGKLTNDVSLFTAGNVYLPIGIITSVNPGFTTGGDGAADVAVDIGLAIIV